MYTKEQFTDGQLLLIDKPLEWSSFQVVNKIKWALRKQFKLQKIKVGHAGTLDPLASGLLIVCTGKYTKKIQEIQQQEKTYTGTLTLGSTTPSYDLETTPDQIFEISHITQALIYETTQQFLGAIEQYPPLFSAIKKDGKRLYEFARAGTHVDISPRIVHINSFIITGIVLPKVHFSVVCSKGTYIRSLVHDFGKALNSGAHLSALRRTKIGKYDVENAQSPEVFVSRLAQ